MSRIEWNRVMVLLLCVGLSYVLAAAIRNSANGAIRAIDFGGVYYGARCVLNNKDPYNPQAALREFQADGGRILAAGPNEQFKDRTVVTVDVYPPTALFVVSPFALLNWSLAEALWVGLSTLLMVVAGYLIWDLATNATVIAGCMVCFALSNCFVMLLCGNPAGIVIPLCVVAAWTFLKERFAMAGAVLLAVSLLIKPHDGGFVWLYFLLAGGTGRKRAVQALAVAGILGISAAIWIAPTSPHWIQGLHRNVQYDAAHGGINDPGSAGLTAGDMGRIISLQSAVSIFRDEPNFYNPFTYAIGGVLILAWAIGVLRDRFSRDSALLAMAAIAPLTLLPIYHRPYDAKLLLLMIPASATLWAGKGARRWIALGLTAAAIFFTSDIPLTFLARVTKGLSLSPSTLSGKLLLLVARPAPVVLLAAGIFYLWAYISYQPSPTRIAQQGGAETKRGTVAAA